MWVGVSRVPVQMSGSLDSLDTSTFVVELDVAANAEAAGDAP
jgi:hypothetical protein